MPYGLPDAALQPVRRQRARGRHEDGREVRPVGKKVRAFGDRERCAEGRALETGELKPVSAAGARLEPAQPDATVPVRGEIGLRGSFGAGDVKTVTGPENGVEVGCCGGCCATEKAVPASMTAVATKATARNVETDGFQMWELHRPLGDSVPKVFHI